MKTKPVKNGREVERILDHNAVPYRHCSGSHAVATLPTGEKLTYHLHGEYGTGIACKITKILVRAGLMIVALAIATPALLQAVGYEIVW